ncbi:cell cycle checkpoint control protein RAD9A [Orussus abietinus]|uniref:cell cycle checkpoint control protein RAD9A n=1 Tax=Orussus abietinus TaxID=222816 RepID=UPI000625456C|nr:cell cycle checkpoint control protein RAD9A [Orussus abietinus]
MKCVVPGANMKILARAIHALARIGDEMYVEPQEGALSIRCVNTPNSAYANFTFCKEYFSYYNLGDLVEDDTQKCKISLRSAMAVFKSPTVLDKQVETCHIKLQSNATHLIFVLKYRNSIIKTHLLPIIDCETLQAAYTKDGAPNQLLSQSRVLADAVQNFPQNLVEITLQVTPQKVLLRNYIDDNSDLCNITRTQLALARGEFDHYVMKEDTSITFCMKEFRALLNFSELVGLPVSIHFESAGRPVVFIIKNISFEVNVVLSTLNPDLDTQSDITAPSVQEKSIRKRASNKKSTRTSAKSKQGTSQLRKQNSTTKSIETNINNKSNLNVNNQPNQEEAAVTEVFQRINVDDVPLINLELNQSNKEVTPKNMNLYKKSVNLPSSSNSTPTSNTRFVNNKKSARSIFSSVSKRKSESESEKSMDVLSEGDSVLNSPPRQSTKRARTIFKKCFQATFDPRMLPGHDTILAEDSDENE